MIPTLAVVAAIIASIVGLMLWLDHSRRAAEVTGAKLEAAKVDAAEVTAMQAILQASASAPDTAAKVENELDHGTF